MGKINITIDPKVVLWFDEFAQLHKIVVSAALKRATHRMLYGNGFIEAPLISDDTALECEPTACEDTVLE